MAGVLSKASLVEWRTGMSTRVVDFLYVPDTAKRWFGLLERVEVPTVPTARSAKEEAIVLLQVGAEVEHALLLQYLFAAYSLRSDNPVAAGWRKTLLIIAKQEMGHLITVQNLLLSLGTAVHFDREDFPLHPALYPFPVLLEPLSQESLAKYVVAEMPMLESITNTTLHNHIAAIMAQANTSAHQDVHRVGMIYSYLYWLFRRDDKGTADEPWNDFVPDPAFSQWHIADEDFVPAAAAAFSTRDEWNPPAGVNVDPGLPRQEALKAIYGIAAQGEGAPQQAGSHFEKFLALYDGFAAFPGAKPVLPVVPNPSTTSLAVTGGAPESRSLITDPTSLGLATLLNLRYEILLLCITRGAQESKTNPPGVRAALIGWALAEMSNINLLGPALASAPLDQVVPAAGVGTPKNAGAPFELTDAPLPSDAGAQWRLLKDLIDRSDRLLKQLGPAATSILNTDTLDDQSTRSLVDQQIAGGQD
jgi:rubrerythrin